MKPKVKVKTKEDGASVDDLGARPSGLVKVRKAKASDVIKLLKDATKSK